MSRTPSLSLTTRRLQSLGVDTENEYIRQYVEKIFKSSDSARSTNDLVPNRLLQVRTGHMMDYHILLGALSQMDFPLGTVVVPRLHLSSSSVPPRRQTRHYTKTSCLALWTVSVHFYLAVILVPYSFRWPMNAIGVSLFRVTTRRSQVSVLQESIGPIALVNSRHKVSETCCQS